MFGMSLSKSVVLSLAGNFFVLDEILSPSNVNVNQNLIAPAELNFDMN